MIIDRSIEEHVAMSFSFRCDSPDKRRFMLMKVNPLENELTEFKSCILREEVRDSVSLLAMDIERTVEVLKICSWCKKVHVDENNWLEVEKAVELLDLFNVSSLPDLSHGMYDMCYENVLKKI